MKHQSQITFHETADAEMTFHDADPRHGGEIGYDFPPAVIQLMVGKILHVHVVDPDDQMLLKSVYAFEMAEYPSEYSRHEQRLVLTPAHHLAGIECQTWLHVPDMKAPYIGVSGYCPSQLAQVVAGLAWAEGFAEHMQWVANNQTV